jgi:CubicO group peptidase (beta-lactamase class C family)/predicted esterase
MLRATFCALGLVATTFLLTSNNFADAKTWEVTVEPADGKANGTAHYRIWLPPNSKCVDGIIVRQHGCGPGARKLGREHADDIQWQALAEKWNCALLGSQLWAPEEDCSTWTIPADGSANTFLRGLKQLASETKHAELEHVPWCLWGHSGGAMWVLNMTYSYPERIVAVFPRSGGLAPVGREFSRTQPAAMDSNPAALTVPIMFCHGADEYVEDSRFYNGVHASHLLFQHGRKQGAPWAIASHPGVGHENGNSRLLAVRYFDAMLARRLPRLNGETPKANVKLPPFKKQNSWYGELASHTVSQSEKDDPTKSCWFVDESMAKSWQEFCKTGDIVDTTIPAPPTHVDVDSTESATTIRWRARADIESGIAAFVILKDGKEIGRVTGLKVNRWNPSGDYHAWNYSDQPLAGIELPELVFVDKNIAATAKPPLYQVATVNKSGLTSLPTPLSIGGEIEKAIERNEISGAVTLVANRGSVVHLQASGLADIGSKTKMSDDTMFAIASMTKPITATAMLILQDRGKLSINDPVSKYIPEFKTMKLADGSQPRPLTIRDLMTHTSGVRRVRNLSPQASLKEQASASAAEPLEFAPGSRWKYGIGLNVCGRIIEVVSGKEYSQFLQQNIFDPLKMNDTTFNPTKQQWPRVAKIYQPGNAQTDSLVVATHAVTNRDLRPTPNPSGGLLSTANDLFRFYQAVLNGGELDGTRIVSAAAAQQMTTLKTGNITTGCTPGNGWGLGWCIVRNPQGVSEVLAPGSYGHGGAFGTQIWVDPTNNAIYLLLIQRTKFGNADGSTLRRDFQQRAYDSHVDPNRKISAKQAAQILKQKGVRVFLNQGKFTNFDANRTKIEDRDLALLSKFPYITDLSFEQTTISDEGIAHLTPLTKLEWLNLFQTQVGDRGLENLSTIKSLKLLPIGETQVTDAGMVHLEKMQQLEYLGVRANVITDEGVKHIAKLTNLERLHLGETKISDAAIPYIAKLTRLKKLYIHDTAITSAGIEQLRAALPKCEIVQ